MKHDKVKGKIKVVNGKIGALKQPRGVGWGGRLKRKEICAYLWLIHVDVLEKPTQYCKAIILQLKISLEKRKQKKQKKKKKNHKYFSAIKRMR